MAAVIGIPLVAVALSGPQWLILRRHAEGSAWWPLANLGGVIIGIGASAIIVRWAMVALGWFAPIEFPSAKVWSLAGLIVGTSYALVTGLALTRLRRR